MERWVVSVWVELVCLPDPTQKPCSRVASGETPSFPPTSQRPFLGKTSLWKTYFFAGVATVGRQFGRCLVPQLGSNTGSPPSPEHRSASRWNHRSSSPESPAGRVLAHHRDVSSVTRFRKDKHVRANCNCLTYKRKDFGSIALNVTRFHEDLCSCYTLKSEPFLVW
jgi:hypothetical protein